MNKVQLIGNLTRDIELKSMQDGSALGKGSIATNKSITNKETGEKKVYTQFHNFVIWGKRAEVLAQYTKKGDKIYLEGELTHSDSTGQDGVKKYYTEVKVTDFEFLNNKRDGEPRRQEEGNQPAEVEGQDDDEIRVENIPF